MVDFQIASDLHFDVNKRGFYPTAKAPVLMLVGDVCSAADKRFKTIMQRIAEPYEAVLYVPGNHDYWGCSSINEGDWLMQQQCAQTANVVYMNEKCIVLRGMAYVGATLWTNLWGNVSADMMNDFSRIGGNFNIAKMREIHYRQTDFIEQSLVERYQDGCVGAVVLTHHAPLLQLSAKASSRSKEWDPFYYCTDINGTNFVQVWVHGHTHESYTTKVRGYNTIYTTNAYGYPDEPYMYKNTVFRIK
jgi:predicted phosphohydrolase